MTRHCALHSNLSACSYRAAYCMYCAAGQHIASCLQPAVHCRHPGQRDPHRHKRQPDGSVSRWTYCLDCALCQACYQVNQSSAACAYLAGRSWPADCHSSSLIIMWSAAAFQTLYHSLSQQGTGTWEGLTFQKQFARAFTVDFAKTVHSLPPTLLRH